MPALSSLAILLFLWTWNQFILAIVMVDDPLKRTMAGALGAFQARYGTDIVLLSAGFAADHGPHDHRLSCLPAAVLPGPAQGAVKG